MSETRPRWTGAATFLSACCAAWATPSCTQILGLDAYYDCPQDGPCASTGTGGNGGHGGSAPSCATPADCPAGGDCATPVCTGGKCGLAAKDDGLACMADAGSGHRCMSGACACPAANQCGAECVDTQSDAMNCGACGTACPAEIACEGGKCACPNGGVVCGAACVDTQTDAMNCGMCGMACTVAGATCEMGACACPGGGTECSGACVDAQTDAMNCGQCGMACTAPTTECAGGSCACPGGQLECSGSCVDAQNDGKNCGACGHDCLGGACQGGRCQPVVLASGTASALASNGSSLFWFLGTTLLRKNLAGGSPTAIATTTSTWIHMALDSTSVYWFAPSSGGNPYFDVEKLAQGGGTKVSLVSSQFYTSSNGGPSGIAVDDQYVYYAQSDTGTIRKVAIGGGMPVAIVSGLSAQLHLAVDDTNLFYTSQKNPYSLPKTGGAATQLATTSCIGGITDFAVDTANVYMGCRGAPNASVIAVPKAGGNVVTLASALMIPSRIAVDATDIYWQDTGDFTINRAPLAGGARVVLATGQGALASLAVDATSVYWTNDVTASVMRLAK